MIMGIMCSCGSKNRISETTSSKEKAMDKETFAGPPTIVYTTKSNYNNLVPVILNDDKTKIVSYPHPNDLTYSGKPAYPYELNKGYLLDNRGININVAFLSLNYSDYMNLEKTPSPDSLYELIIDKDPIVEMYNCGNRHKYDDVVSSINEIIDKGELNKCKKLSK